MNLWKYYNGDLKYPNINNYSHEKEIAKHNLHWAFGYVSDHGKDEDLEPIIAKNALYSYYYAKNILKGPFELGEPAIAKDMEFSYSYAMLINRRFELGEPAIAENPYYSYWYTKNILKGPFKLGEPTIANYRQHANSYTQYANSYTHDVLKKDFYLDGKLICKYEG